MRSRSLTGVLLALYLAVLTWIILFKMQTDWTVLTTGVRTVNLIPFAGALVTNGQANYQEVFLNLVAFVPFGLYLSLLEPRWPARKRCPDFSPVWLMRCCNTPLPWGGAT